MRTPDCNVPQFSTSLPVYACWTRRKMPRTRPLTFHHEFEIHLIKYGQGAYYIAGETYAFNGSCLVVIRSGQAHKFISTHNACMEKATVLFKKCCLDRITGSLIARNTFPSVIEISMRQALQLELLIDRIIDEYTHKEAHWEKMIRHTLSSFVLWVVRARVTPKEPLPPNPLFLRLHQYIEQNSTDPECSVTAISKKFGYSLSHLSSLFKEASGIGIKKFLTEHRVIAARKLIDSNPSLKMESIAVSSGFNSYRNFTRAFISQTGMPPSSYRESRHPNCEK